MISRSLVHIGLIFAVIAFFPADAKSGTDTPAAIVGAFEQWMRTHGIKEGAIAIGFKGETVATKGYRRDAEDPAPVASLSKAITAACVTTAMAESGKALSAPLSEVLTSYLGNAAAPRDKRFLNITVAQLIAQNSGMTIDITQKQLRRLKSTAKENMDWQFKQQVKNRLGKTPGSKYNYNNSNYLMLGLVVNEQTGQSHEDYCKAKIFAPLGITTARLNPDWKVMSSYGGWMVSASDYLKFANWAFADNKILGTYPFMTPRSKLGRGKFYGSGVFFRSTMNGFNFWHAGRWGGTGKKKARFGFGAYFAVYSNGYSIALNYRFFPTRKISAALDDGLYRAAHK